MTGTSSNVKRWQVGIRGILAYIAMLTPPLIVWSWAMGAGEPGVWKVAVILGFTTAGGAIGATLGWLITGRSKGFFVGYLVGAILGFYSMTFLIAHHLLAVIDGGFR